MQKKHWINLVVLILLGIIASFLFMYLFNEKSDSHQAKDEHEHSKSMQHEDTLFQKVLLSDEALKENHIKVEEVGSIDLPIKFGVMGKITPNEELTVHISARFPGVVKSVNKKLGDSVQKGEVLAVIESNESLKNYQVKSEINGRIIKKNINLGMSLTSQETIFVISDLNSVWGDFNIYAQDLSRVQIGDFIEVTSLDGSLTQQGEISYLSWFGNENTQSVVARVVLNNTKDIWKPGLFVSGEITAETISIPVAVKTQALQTIQDVDAVFVSRHNNEFEASPVKLGKKSKEWVEIKSGLKVGERYVSENSFILKAELEKSAAEHEH